MDNLEIKLKRPTAELRKEAKRVLTELFELMAKGEEEIYFSSLTQGMWDIETQLKLNLTTMELFGDTFFLHKMAGTEKCSVYKWKGDHLLRVDDY